MLWYRTFPLNCQRHCGQQLECLQRRKCLQRGLKRWTLRLTSKAYCTIASLGEMARSMSSSLSTTGMLHANGKECLRLIDCADTT
ncbi:predicted protein [Plenodomus lingam JN3]|uniref:Predicted protein n=1 Tax=Leptosphaeria maculans (strain JN3 / isolate v23.1.3 / race Av1-4-5-6-7-8) TaxID=985895 RepID=E4ZJF9_LEPMJ|nr:predicted protein [Plenodomus lingam JN3]CBX91590.1 predicted protein [Plenodomus lingam JN3]